jgi:DNA repair ATPase RecN
MNSGRRNLLGTLIDRIEKFKPEFASLKEVTEKLTKLKAEVTDIRDTLETIQSEEQAAYDNLSERAQQGERGQTMSDALAEMDTAATSLTNIEDALDTLLEGLSEDESEINTAISSIDNARGQQ